MENTDNNENNLYFFIDKNETQVMHTKSDNVEIMNGMILVMLLINLLILL